MLKAKGGKSGKCGSGGKKPSNGSKPAKTGGEMSPGKRRAIDTMKKSFERLSEGSYERLKTLRGY